MPVERNAEGREKSICIRQEEPKMKRALLIFAALMAAILSVHRVEAHHSFGATYLEDKQESLDGTVVQMLFRNPHSYLQIDVKDASGQAVRWNIEWGGVVQLNQKGVTRDTLKPGDHVIVVGNPSRTAEDHRLRLVKISRPSDGWTWGASYE
jgi:hypothetical protein